MRSSRTLFLVLACGLAFGAISEPAAAAKDSCAWLSDQVTRCLQLHTRARSLDDDFRQRVARRYLAALVSRFPVLREAQPAKTSLQSSVELIDRGLLEMRSGDCGWLDEVHRRLGVEVVVEPVEAATSQAAGSTAPPRLTRSESHAGLLAALARTLDPHSDFEAIGSPTNPLATGAIRLDDALIVLQRDGEATIVDQFIPGWNTPASHALRPGDRVGWIRIGDWSWSAGRDADFRELERRLRASPAVNVEVGSEPAQGRRHVPAPTSGEVWLSTPWPAGPLRVHHEQRDIGGSAIRLALVEVTSLLPEGSGSTALREWIEQASEAIAVAAVDHPADGLLLDLSQQRGGSIDAAIALASIFVGSAPVVAIEGRSGSMSIESGRFDRPGFTGPVVVVISSATASAAEVIAGALADHRRAVIVGSARSFGKGTLQTIFPLEAGQASLTLTTGMMYRPTGAPIQSRGVSADVVSPFPFDAEAGSEERLPGALVAHEIEPTEATTMTVARRGANGTVPVSDDIVARLAERSASRRRETATSVSSLDEAVEVLIDLIALSH